MTRPYLCGSRATIDAIKGCVIGKTANRRGGTAEKRKKKKH